jgi:hypothetical protein
VRIAIGARVGSRAGDWESVLNCFELVLRVKLVKENKNDIYNTVSEVRTAATISKTQIDWNT